MSVQKYKPKRTGRVLEKELAAARSRAEESVGKSNHKVERSKKLIASARAAIERARSLKRA